MDKVCLYGRRAVSTVVGTGIPEPEQTARIIFNIVVYKSFYVRACVCVCARDVARSSRTDPTGLLLDRSPTRARRAMVLWRTWNKVMMITSRAEPVLPFNCQLWLRLQQKGQECYVSLRVNYRTEGLIRPIRNHRTRNPIVNGERK